MAVWTAVTAGTAAAWAVAGAPAARAGAAGTWSGSFADLLEPVCAIALLAAVSWLWASTTATVAEVLRGRVPRPGRGLVRRLVLVACGAAVAAGTAAPVAAAGGRDEPTLAGLRLPDRAVGVPHAATADRPVAGTRRPEQPSRSVVHVVRAGDSLWSLAEATAAPGADIDARWRAIWDANREVIGDDPDLILPGQRLRLPATDTTSRGTDPDQTGDRP